MIPFLRLILPTWRHCALLLVVGNLFVSCRALAVSSSDNGGIPALLQFAEQYYENNGQPRPPAPPQLPEKPATSRPEKTGAGKPMRNDKTPASATSVALRWQTKEAELQRLQMTVIRQEKQLNVLKKKLAEMNPVPSAATAPVLINAEALSTLAHGVRQALSLTPREQRARDAVKRDKQQALQIQQDSLTLQKVNRALQSQLSQANKAYQLLDIAHKEIQVQVKTATEKAERQDQQQTALQHQRQSLQKEKESCIQEITMLRAELAMLQARAPTAITAAMLEHPANRKDYAAGVSLGEEILQMQTERKKWGVNTDKKTILAGIVDTFNGQRQLGDEQLKESLAASEKQVVKARDKVVKEQSKQGAAYLANFKKGSQVKQTPAGAWYRIDYPGDSALSKNSTVDLVVKEMLTDGTVIQDMESNGARLSQPIADYPPLFKEAITQLKNHGSLTFVVPPALAYGEKGYPPAVPPNATMVYTLRIAEVYPEKS